MSTALYRRYRPESFADVIGQEHVTEPLMQALRSGRVNHAYLFSGPRGCGKTTSARILARCLNCEKGPTPEPCGTCESCVALARQGAGSVDVIEIDAASHGRVDDTRELRERAAFGPAQSRFKIYIIDEAHMVSREGFNSLLKIVEEPPPHVKFIFATTEPEKVLATIRSRTHHYPFHLVPPQRLTGYLEQLCTQEGVRLEPGVLSFVTRAGGGSVRDSLSALDQLISGAGQEGLTYERTAALLGFTDVELLDAVVDAVAAGDSATVFQQVDRVMESGHDPRRFVEDLLERYRDLIVLAAVGEQAGGLLPGLPEDQVERMRRQAQGYGPAGLSRAADLVARGLSEMAGAVSYRLMLELLAARLLLPAAAGEDGYGARLDRIERRLAAGPAADEQPVGSPRQPGAPGPEPQPTPAWPGSQPTGQPAPVGPPPAAPSGPAQGPAGPPPGPGPGTAPGSDGPPRPGDLDTAALRRHWPDIIAAVREISRRTAGALESIQVVDYDGRRLLVGMPDERWIRHFMGTSNEEALRQGVLDALALDVRIEATVAGADGPHPPGVGEQTHEARPVATAPPSQQQPGEPARPPSSPRPTAGPDDPPAGPGDPPEGPGEPEGHGEPPVEPGAAPAASGAPAGAQPPVGDAPPRGRLRTRGGQTPPQPAQAPGSNQPVRVRGRGGGGAGGETPSGPAEPSMAEQLGAVGARPPAEVGPDWAQSARSTAAPAWATEGSPSFAGAGAGEDDAIPQAPQGPPGPGQQEQVARRAERPTDGQLRPEVHRGPPRAGGPDPQEREAVRARRGPTAVEEFSDAPSDDDEDLGTSGGVGQPVIETVLGGTVIEINDEPVA
ncbi:DNA polymerase III subunit gamma and tau [Ornithinimicrobium pratense]|uniref:DNA-directed DNA polymerase n=1 Tax=Ornithinimicrobium pratense TaxID=2593973 RepID=A0A5J6V1R6_9MICO|nr:DNA polymerase III subunit gamma and tau [Ornithinimicrobium pratense]QFG67568.1 DNA polymerase III subunit gamma and tau [Ornithinimicrobium pratense]